MQRHDYKMGDELGSGISGRTYAATHTSTGEEVAIKIQMVTVVDNLLYDGKYTPDTPNYLRELRVMKKRLSCVPKFMEHWIEEGHSFLVMEMLHTPSKHMIDLNRDYATLLDWLMERHGILQVDVNTGNLMYTSNGEPRLIDFGYAVSKQDVDSETFAALLTLQSKRLYEHFPLGDTFI